MSTQSPDPYVHNVGPWQHWTGRLLRRVPFALCGMWLGMEPDVEYPEPDGPPCPSCASQITVREWLRLPKYERAERIAEFKNADNELQAVGTSPDEDETYLRLNGRVNDLWPTVPWWCREPALPHPGSRHRAALYAVTTAAALVMVVVLALSLSGCSAPCSGHGGISYELGGWYHCNDGTIE